MSIRKLMSDANEQNVYSVIINSRVNTFEPDTGANLIHDPIENKNEVIDIIRAYMAGNLIITVDHESFDTTFFKPTNLWVAPPKYIDGAFIRFSGIGQAGPQSAPYKLDIWTHIMGDEWPEFKTYLQTGLMK